MIKKLTFQKSKFKIKKTAITIYLSNCKVPKIKLKI